jgi:hypothetical protein
MSPTRERVLYTFLKLYLVVSNSETWHIVYLRLLHSMQHISPTKMEELPFNVIPLLDIVHIGRPDLPAGTYYLRCDLGESRDSVCCKVKRVFRALNMQFSSRFPTQANRVALSPTNLGAWHWTICEHMTSRRCSCITYLDFSSIDASSFLN